MPYQILERKTNVPIRDGNAQSRDSLSSSKIPLIYVTIATNK
jgi:hypothetical protein